jgi:hypothetical protein
LIHIKTTPLKNSLLFSFSLSGSVFRSVFLLCFNGD